MPVVEEAVSFVEVAVSVIEEAVSVIEEAVSIVEEAVFVIEEAVSVAEVAVVQELSVERVEFCTFVFNGVNALCLGLVLTYAVDKEMPVEEELLVVFVELELLVVSEVELLAADELSVVELLAVVELSVVVFVPEEKLAWHDWSIFAETFFGGVEFCSSVDKFLF